MGDLMDLQTGNLMELHLAYHLEICLADQKVLQMATQMVGLTGHLKVQVMGNWMEYQRALPKELH